MSATLSAGACGLVAVATRCRVAASAAAGLTIGFRWASAQGTQAGPPVPPMIKDNPQLEVVDSVVTVDLINRGERTELLLTHELPPDPKIRRGHEEGWEGCLGNLEEMFSKIAHEGRQT